MAIPAYIWLQDDGGADIKGSVDVQNRVGHLHTFIKLLPLDRRYNLLISSGTK